MVELVIVVRHLLGFLMLAVCMGTIVVGFGMLLPVLDAQQELLDANLAAAVGRPLALRLSDTLLTGAMVLAVITPSWVRHRMATTLALLLLSGATLQRIVVLPRVHEAWSLVDRVTGRPLDRVLDAERWSSVHLGILTCLFMISIAMVWLASRWSSNAPGVAARATPRPA